MAWSHAAAELGCPSHPSNIAWWVHSDGMAVVQEWGDPEAAPARAPGLKTSGLSVEGTDGKTSVSISSCRNKTKDTSAARKRV